MQKQQSVRNELECRQPTRRRQPAVMMLDSLEGRRLLSGGDVVIQWNELLQQSLTSNPSRILPPRNMALVQVAMFDAVNAIDRSYESYHADVRAPRGASPEAAAAQAAHDTLVALYPSRQAIFDAQLAADLAGIPPGQAKLGAAVGKAVAQEILELRADDGAGAVVTYTPPNNDPGQWQQTPPDFSAAAAAHVPLMTPFALQSNSQFLPGPPPALTSPAYAADFNEAKTLGRSDSTVRTADQTLVGRLWQPALPHFQVWNRVAQDVVQASELSLPQTARLFALLDMTMSDALATSFAAKYEYALWRPVTAIHRAAEDGNPATEADPTWTTLHPATPPYPTYSGNAATIGAASASVLADVFGTDDIAFNIDWGRYGFSGVTRSYPGFSAAANEEADSRIYGGIHFRFDSTAGQQIGTDVAGYVMEHFLKPQRTGAASEANGAPGTDHAHRSEVIISSVFNRELFKFSGSSATGPDVDTSDDETAALLA